MSEQAHGTVNDDDDVSAALGQRLIASGVLTQAGFERALRSPDHGLSFGAVLTSLGLASKAFRPCLLKAFVEKGRISLFWPIFIFCRIELIFGRLTCFDMKSIVP